MGIKKKYEAIQGYWVYSIKVPSIEKFYIGISKQQCVHRWQKSKYMNSSLNQYLDEWDSMIKTVLVDGLTKEESYQYEGKIIDALSINNLCLNSNRSGLIASDKNAYGRGLRKTNTEYREREKQRAKQWYENNKEKKREYDKQRRLKKKLEKQQHTVVH